MNKKKGQALIEYALIIGIAAVAVLPFVSPYARETGQKIVNSAPVKSPKIKHINFAEQKAVDTVGINPVTPNIEPIKTKETQPDLVDPKSPPVDPPPTPTPPPIPKVFMFGNLYLACDYPEQGLVDMFKEYFRCQGSTESGMYELPCPNGVYFDNIFDRLKPDAIAAADNYCVPDGKTILINEDGSLFGVYQTDDIINSNLNLPVADYNTDGELAGWASFNDVQDQVINLPGNKKAYIVQDSFLSPLSFDIEGKGIRTTEKKIWFDLNGDGKKEYINDVLNGVLCIRGGKSGLDLFGDNTDLNNDKKPDGYKNGFDALKALSAKEKLINYKNDMKLNSKDLTLLEKKYKLMMKIVGYQGKLTHLNKLGITEINLGNTDKVTVINDFDKRGNKLMKQEGATFKINGILNTFADVWHKIVDFAKNTAENVKKLFTA